MSVAVGVFLFSVDVYAGIQVWPWVLRFSSLSYLFQFPTLAKLGFQNIGVGGLCSCCVCIYCITLSCYLAMFYLFCTGVVARDCWGPFWRRGAKYILGGE